MKKVLLSIVLIFSLFTMKCKSKEKIYEYGDFQYRIFQLNDEGKIIYSVCMNYR